MAGKGIIHRNTASRYKSRLSARYAKTRLGVTSPHSSTTSRSSRARGSPAEVLMARSVRKTASTAELTFGAGTFVLHEPGELPENHVGHGAVVHHQPELAQRVAGRAALDGVASRPSRPATSPAPTTSFTSASVIALFPAA